MAKGFWKPTVALVGVRGRPEQIPGVSDPTFTATLGLEVSLSAAVASWRRLGERSRIGKGGSVHRRWKASNLEVKQKHLRITEKLHSWELAVLTLEQAEESYEFTKARYELGAAQNLEVLTAQNTLYQCRFEELSAGYDYFLAVMELYQAMGKTEQFLEEVKPDA